MRKLYRQGDVLIREVESIPAGEVKARKDGILAHGEVTGHCHAIEDHQAAQLFDVGEGMFMQVSESGVSIVHQEHGPIVLPPGNYEVVRQREYSPEEIRNVAD